MSRIARGNSSGSDSCWGTSPVSPSPTPPKNPSSLLRVPRLASKRACTVVVTVSPAHSPPGVNREQFAPANGTSSVFVEAEEGQEMITNSRGSRNTGSLFGRMTIWLLVVLALLATVPALGFFRAISSASSSSSSSSSSSTSSLSSTASRTAEGSASLAGARAEHQPRRERGSSARPGGSRELPGSDGVSSSQSRGGRPQNHGASSSSPVQGGMRRCWTDEEGRGRCLPTVFFFGVSKCGTTSLSNWLAEHPRAVFVPPPEEHDFREAHVFDGSPQFWHNLDTRGRREILSPVATPEDTVIDFTPNYAVMGEAPLRIFDFYGEGILRKNLRFLVVLREPVARTISSWEYKNELDDEQAVDDEQDLRFSVGRRVLAPTKPPPPRTVTNNATAAGRRRTSNISSPSTKLVSAADGEQEPQPMAIVMQEQRPLWQAFEEGVDRAGRLSDCLRNATDNGLFGREATTTFCRATKGPKQCNGHPPCELCSTHSEPWCNPRHYLEEPLYNAHVAKSMYAMQLRRWFSVFGRDAFKVVFTEDMEANPVETLAEVLDFLGLDMLDPQGEKGLRSLEVWGDVVGARYNTADGAKKRVLDSQVTPELRERMRAFFAPHNKDLQALLGVPLPKSWHFLP